VITKVADPAKAAPTDSTSFSLTVDGKPHYINIGTKTLSAIAAAINADTDAGVRATVVNVGPADDPDYRLSVQSTKLGPVVISLSAGTTFLLDEQSRGSRATYNVNGAKVNGVEQVASSDSRSVQIAPGVTVTLLQQNATAVDITVTRRSSAVSDALSGLAAAYNAAVDEIDRHRGQAGGALSGQSVIIALSQSLARLTGYTASGAVSCLKDAGLSLDETGHLDFNSMSFIATDFKYPGAVAAFLGFSSGGGFLKSAAAALDVVEHPATGSLKAEISSVQVDIAANDSRIANEQSRVDDLKQRLYEQMAAADAMIAAMERQYNYISSMFESMRAASQSYG
jgi:flagellar capping protein FliD